MSEELVSESTATSGAASRQARRAVRPELTTGPLLPTMLRLAAPLVLAQMLQTVYNVVDTFWVGRIGPDAVAAITLSFPIIIFLISMAAGLTIAGTALVAQYTGAKQPEHAAKAAAQSLVAVIITSVGIGIVGILAAEFLLTLVGATPEVLPMAKSYFTIYLAGVPFVFLSFGYQSVLRGVGDTVTPLKLRAFATALNIILDPILIFGWLGVPAMGIAGAAVATVIALGIEGIWGTVLLLRGAGGLGFRREHFRPDWTVIRRIFRIGSPAALEMTAGTIGLSLMTAIVALSGMQAVAAFGIGMRLQSLILLPAFGIGMATTTMVGQNVGAGKPQRAEQAAWMAAAITFGTMAVFCVFGVLFPSTLIGIFNDDPEVLRYGTSYLQIAGPAISLMGIRIVISGAFRGAGNSVPAMVLSFVLVLLLEAPLAYLLAQVVGWGPNGIWWSNLVAGAVGAVWASLWFRRGRWKERAITRAEPNAPLAQPTLD